MCVRLLFREFSFEFAVEAATCERRKYVNSWITSFVCTEILFTVCFLVFFFAEVHIKLLYSYSFFCLVWFCKQLLSEIRKAREHLKCLEKKITRSVKQKVYTIIKQKWLSAQV